MPVANRPNKARVFRNGGSQAVRIPATFRFSTDEVYIRRDPETGVVHLSEKPFPSRMEEIRKLFDEAGAGDFTIERDLSLPEEKNLF